MDKKLKGLLDKYGISVELIERRVVSCYFLENDDIKFPFDIPRDYENKLSESFYDDTEYLFNIYVEGELCMCNITEEELNELFKDLLEGRKMVIKEEW